MPKHGSEKSDADARSQVERDSSPSRRDKLEDFWEHRIIFGSRWLLAPAYGVLVLVLAVLAYKTVEEFLELLSHWNNANEARTIAQVLVIVDIILVMNLVLMVLFVGYVNFVSKIDFNKFGEHPERWSRFPGQFGGLAKVDSGFDYAASFSCSICVA